MSKPSSSASSKQPKQPIAKYRPVLTAPQIEHILALCKYSIDQKESMAIIGILAPFQAKIQNAGINIAYQTSPKQSIEESLGMASNSSFSNLNFFSAASTTYSSKEAYWEGCYNRYTKDPAACTLAEIHAAREHMYLNDLMSDDEVREFEATHTSNIQGS